MPRHARRTLAAASLTLLAVSAMVAPAAATYPGPNGRVTFMRYDDNGQYQVWVANPDMTHQVQLTSGPSDAWFPSWSPAGTQIVFASHRTDPDPSDETEIMDVFTMRSDGSDVRKVTDSVGYSGTASWSPDGRWIVYSADRGVYPGSQGIYLIRSDGSGSPRRLTSLPEGSLWQELPRFSPDGSRIAYTEYRGGHVLKNHRAGLEVAQQAAIFSVRLDGTDIRRLTPWGIHAGDADWSPDGSRLVFSGQPEHIGDIGDIQVVDADGMHLTDLTQDGTLTGIGRDTAIRYIENFNPAFSPDGSKIIFVRAEYTAETGFHMGLVTMNPDGSGRVRISEGFEHQPDWGIAPPIAP
jgi:Tol biopolymer transport system component